MTVAYYVVAALGLAVLMIVHEGGHYFAARRYGMRVMKFSIGFGPRIWHKQPKGSPTTFQVAIIPFLAYVQIAGMNPYEDNDPNDKGSYANASLWARIVTIVGRPARELSLRVVPLLRGARRRRHHGGRVEHEDHPDAERPRRPRGPRRQRQDRLDQRLVREGLDGAAEGRELAPGRGDRHGDRS